MTILNPAKEHATVQPSPVENRFYAVPVRVKNIAWSAYHSADDHITGLRSFNAVILGWQPEPFFNIRTRKVGGLRFVWIGRIVFSFCIRREI